MSPGRPAASEPSALHERLGSATRRFSRADHASDVLVATDSPVHVVTGFGPTNAPTAGSLAVMLGTIELQRKLATPTTVVISELGAWNSRNVAWPDLERVRDQMYAFIAGLGFDDSFGELRSHLHPANLIRAGRIARFLERQDFLSHREDLLELYQDEGLLASEVGLTVDTLYTVADVLEPAERGIPYTLMLSGHEEAYFTELARLVLARQAEAGALDPGWRSHIGALYFRVLPGLGGYPKMSKSIPASAIHLGMPEGTLRERILSERPADQTTIMDAMELASGWSEDKLALAREAFATREREPIKWRRFQNHYLGTFLHFAEQWRKAGS